MKFIAQTMLIVALVALASWAFPSHAALAPKEASAPAYEEGSACYERIKKDRAARASAEQWNECIKIFEAHARAHASTPTGATAAYSAARLSKEMAAATGNAAGQEQALKYYNYVVSTYPSSPLADDALLQIAIIRQQRGEGERSRSALKALIERYPTSDSAAEARSMLSPSADSREAKPAVSPINEADSTIYSSNEGRAAPARISTAAPSSVGTANELKTSAATGSEVVFSDDAASSKDPGILLGVAGARDGNNTIVTLSLNRPVDYRVTYDGGRTGFTDASSLTVLLKETHPHAGLAKDVTINSPLIRQTRIKQRILGGTQLIFDLAGGARYTLVNYRRSLDIVLSPSAGLEASVNPRALTPVEADKLTLPTELGRHKERSFSLASLAFWKRGTAKSTERKYTIVIDPGHGGDEDGAIGPHGIKEKDIVLSVAQKLASELERETGSTVYLTRDTDKSMSLKDRYTFAKKKKADLFISVHANASSDPRNAGIETYYLDNASDEAAKRLAERENESWRGSRSDIDRVLATMLQNDVSDESRLIAEKVQGLLITYLGKQYKGVRDRNVRSALFYVLVGAQCPSILIETSFITNPREEMRLSDQTYQQRIASAIAQGVGRFRSTAPTAAASL